jgi:hypothetical protein
MSVLAEAEHARSEQLDNSESIYRANNDLQPDQSWMVAATHCERSERTGANGGGIDLNYSDCQSAMMRLCSQ